jgi:hypothetical protein
MDKWAEIARLVNTIEECRKRLVEVLESLEFEGDFLDNTTFFYGTYESHYIEVVDGKLYISSLNHKTNRRFRTVVGNLDLELLFILGQELLARREKLRLKGEVKKCHNTTPKCLREAKAMLVVNGRIQGKVIKMAKNYE